MKKFVVALAIILLAPFSVILGGVTGFLIDGGLRVSIGEEKAPERHVRRYMEPWQKRIENGPSLVDILNRRYRKKISSFRATLSR